MISMMGNSLPGLHLLANFFTTTNLQLFLLVGSGILAICLLVLALTRWGQSRPVWKCVFLSFCAHILLMAYAYGTHLIFESPRIVDVPNPMRVNLVEDFGESIVSNEIEDVEDDSWDDFVNDQPLPNIDPLERPVIDSEVVIQRTPDREIAQPTTQSTPELPPKNTDDFQPLENPANATNEMAAIEIDNPTIAAPKVQVNRRDEDEPAAAAGPKFNQVEQAPRAELNNEFQTAQKPDELSNQPAERPTFQGDLIAKDAEIPLVDPSSIDASDAPEVAKFKPLKPLRAPNRMKLVASTRRIGDGQPMPKIYSLRNVENRSEVAQRRGGSVRTEQAVNDALRWLAANQEGNGRWDSSRWGAGRETKVFGHDRKGAGADADCGITGLATLAFLAAGYTHLEGPYQNEIRGALEFLVRQQTQDGCLAGEAKLFARMYCHSMSLLALSEALAITGDLRLQSAVQRGVDYSVRSQNRKDGGWRYQPGDSGDMSQFGWQVLALESAKLGGAVVPRATHQRMEKFLEECSSGVGGGLASYKPGQGPSTTMTAEALLCRYVLKKTVSAPTLMEASRRIAQERPTPHHVNLYYWYYGTLAMYHAGGPDWERWNTEMKKTLLSLQEQSGRDAGSYPPTGIWGGYGGRVYATAMATLNLEVYYRYLPMHDVASERPNQAQFR